MWNCPCGYLDYDETTKECAVRECFEETGVQIPIDSLVFINYEDDPVTANRQNVTFRFGAKIENHITTDFKFSKEKNEGAEVGEIKWVKVKDIDNYEWAFNHKTRIEEISLYLDLWGK
jgi:8-oxo-dGTP pyrophosphatase MutT (NUDIX family)